MGPIDYFSWLVLVVIVITAVVIVVVLAQLPGKTAAANNHPNATAINIAGWLGIFTGIVWIIALIWANTRPLSGSSSQSEELEALKARIALLEEQSKGEGSTTC